MWILALLFVISSGSFVRGDDTEYGFLELGHQKHTPCPLASFTKDKHSVYLQEVSLDLYPSVSRKNDGLYKKFDEFCLYQSVGNEFHGPLITFFVQNSTMTGIYAESRQIQYKIPKQELKSDLKIRLIPYKSDDKPPSFLPGAKTAHGDFNKVKLLELFAVVDKTMIENDGDELMPKLLVTVGTADQMLRAIGLRVRLVKLDRWEDGDKFQINQNISDTLGNLASFRVGLDPAKVPIHDSMHLFTGKVQDSRGKAYIGGMCRYVIGASTTSTANRDNLISRAAALSHEIGHLLGSKHDNPSWREDPHSYTQECSCPDEDCIMTPTMADPGPLRWSNCSMEDMLRTIHDYDSDFTCLSKHQQAFQPVASSAICGNGQVEPGEDCDFGLHGKTVGSELLKASLSDAACDPATCKFTTPIDKAIPLSQEKECPWRLNDQRGHVNDECCYARAGAWLQRKDDSPCDEDKGFCRGGLCQSRDSQCRRGFGPEFVSASLNLYKVNGGRSWSSGYCSYRPRQTDFEQYHFETVACPDKDKECGALLCVDPSREGVDHVDVSRYDMVLKHTLTHPDGHAHVYVSAVQDHTLSGTRDPMMVPEEINCNGFWTCRNSTCAKN